MSTQILISIRPWLPHIVLAALGTAVATIAGLQSIGASSGSLPLILVAAAVGVVLLALAYTHFEAFLLLTLGIRASVDWTNAPASIGEPTTSGAMTTAVALLFLVAAVVWLLVQFEAGNLLPLAPLSLAWLAFLGIAVLSAIASDRPLESVAEAGRIATAVVMLLVLQQLLVERRQVLRVLAACYASAILPLLVAGYQVLTGSTASIAGGIARVHGTFLHPNAFGFYLAILVVMGVALLPHLSRVVKRLLLPLLCGFAVLLILTYSRGSWLALVLGLVVVGILQNRRLLIPVLALTAVLALSIPPITARLSDLREEQNVAGVPSSSLDWRLGYWKTVIDLASDSPVVGIGPKLTQYATDQAKVPHNDFLRAYVETGILGLGAYAAVVVALILTARRALRNAAEGFDRGVAVGFAGCAAAFILFSLAENLMSQVVVLWYFVAFAAAAIFISRSETTRNGWSLRDRGLMRLVSSSQSLTLLSIGGGR